MIGSYQSSSDWPVPGSSSAAHSPKLPGHHPSYRKLVEWAHEGSGGLGHGRGLSGVQYTILICFYFGQVLREVGWSKVKKKWGKSRSVWNES